MAARVSARVGAVPDFSGAIAQSSLATPPLLMQRMATVTLFDMVIVAETLLLWMIVVVDVVAVVVVPTACGQHAGKVQVASGSRLAWTLSLGPWTLNLLRP